MPGLGARAGAARRVWAGAGPRRAAAGGGRGIWIEAGAARARGHVGVVPFRVWVELGVVPA
eukprot:scaffold404_cov101-Isochrysis_galbana.AAC.9